ncbi:MAG: hypothetical protein RLZZ423_789 [Cyanobacteriota bacterium]|jgi:hypothetical protein
MAISLPAPAMAAPKAYDQPTLNGAWEAFLAHVPTILLIWIATAVLSGVGLAVYLLITLVGLGLSGGGSGGEPALSLATALGQLGQVPFAILSSLVGVLFVAVPALHYERGEVISVQDAFAALLRRPLRYLLAGVLFTLVLTIGFVLCIVPGIVVALVMPIYVNRIFLTDQSITDAFAHSFQAVYGSKQGRSYAGVEILAWLLVLVVSVCTCGLGALLAVPVSSFYLQNAAYHKGVIS